MIRLATLQVLITSILLSNNNHPIILVHGFLGWGKEEVGDKSYWGGENDIEKYLNDKGFQVYSVSLGPVSSTYDCAIETFYQIKGGQVDYGQEHSEKYKIISDGKKWWPRTWFQSSCDVTVDGQVACKETQDSGSSWSLSCL